MTITLHVSDEPSPEYRITCPSDIVNLDKIAKRKTECFALITLNSAHSVIKTRILFTGTLNRCLVHPRDVYRSALLDNAAAIILVHNHPSGRTEPSQEDRDMTHKLCSAGTLLDIPVLDHVIVSTKGLYSFVEHGLINP